VVEGLQDWTHVTIAFENLSLVEKAKIIQGHVSLEGEGLIAQRNYLGWKSYMDSYMADYK
jgi:hypothetical protein